MSCVFCNIVNDQLPCNKIYEDDNILAFHDINPFAPIHFLVIPKSHISCVDEINYTNSNIITGIFERISILAKELGLSNGYRVVTNCGEDACQTVKHLHFHVMGGRKLSCSFC